MLGEKTFKGTAGDWRVHERSGYQGEEGLTGAWIETDDLLVAEVRGAVVIEGFRHEEHTANAYLIAGAKGLLKAAQILASLEADDGGRRFPTKEEIVTARAAISQALGGE